MVSGGTSIGWADSVTPGAPDQREGGSPFGREYASSECGQTVRTCQNIMNIVRSALDLDVCAITILLAKLGTEVSTNLFVSASMNTQWLGGLHHQPNSMTLTPEHQCSLSVCRQLFLSQTNMSKEILEPRARPFECIRGVGARQEVSQCLSKA